jgi:hypothetical protein
VGELVELAGERRLARLLGLEQAGDVSDLGLHPGRGDTNSPAPRVTLVFM